MQPGGSIYVAWHSIESASAARIEFASSSDGGRSWNPPRALAELPAQAFSPTIAVTPEGVVGVTFYDLRNDEVGDDELIADLWFRYSDNGGGKWKEEHVAGPFDLRTKAYYPVFPMGDYFGLTPTRSGFGAVFGQLNPGISATGPSDIVFAELRVKSK